MRSGTPALAGGRARWGAIFALAALLGPGPARAYRPFDSTDAAVANEGDVELELAPVGWRKEAGEPVLIAPGLVLNWGFADRLEAVLEGKQLFPLGRRAAAPRYRLDDTALSLKAVLRQGGLQGREGPSVATEAGMLLPTVNAGPGAGAQLALIVSQRWTAMTVHVNGQVQRTRAGEPGAAGGIILEGPDRWRVRPVAELLVEKERASSSTRSALLGLIWRLRDGLSLDAAVRGARAGRGDAAEVRLGLTLAFPVKEPAPACGVDSAEADRQRPTPRSTPKTGPLARSYLPPGTRCRPAENSKRR